MYTAVAGTEAIGSDTVFSPNARKAVNVLIVDDDITNRLVLQGILNKQGYQSHHAENGLQAVELFERLRPDLILMDVMMPVMDGYQAAHKIKSLSKDEFVPIIFLTAMTDENALVKCVDSGGDDFLTKPYNHVILKARMDALLRIRYLYNTIKEQKNEITLHQHRMEREAKIAETLFSNVLSSQALTKDYIKYLLSPMSLFSGDMLIAADKPSGGIHLMLGDFTGHGLAAATGALPVSSIFYEMTDKGYSIVEIVDEINTKMKMILPIGMFLAACLVDINPVNRRVTIWNGGLPDVLIYSSSKKKIVGRIASNHLPLGIVDGGAFDSTVDVVNIYENDKIYIYSDGVIETPNANNEMFGMRRLEDVFVQQQNPRDLFDTVKKRLDEHRGASPQKDDVTLAELTFVEQALDATDSLVRNPGTVAQPAAHWQISLQIDADGLRNTDPLPVIVQAVTQMQGLSHHRQHIYMIVAELFSNALEHGILQLDSKMKSTADGFARYYNERTSRLAALKDARIIVSAKHTPYEEGGCLLVRIEDSGEGFNYSEIPLDLAQNESNSGRGLALLNKLCRSVNYAGRGNIVEASYVW